MEILTNEKWYLCFCGHLTSYWSSKYFKDQNSPFAGSAIFDEFISFAGLQPSQCLTRARKPSISVFDFCQIFRPKKKSVWEGRHLQPALDYTLHTKGLHKVNPFHSHVAQLNYVSYMYVYTCFLWVLYVSKASLKTPKSLILKKKETHIHFSILI